MAKNCEPLSENPLSEETIARVKWLANKYAQFTSKFTSTGVSTQVLPGTGMRITIEREDTEESEGSLLQRFAELPPEDKLFAVEFIQASKRMGKI